MEPTNEPNSSQHENTADREADAGSEGETAAISNESAAPEPQAPPDAPETAAPASTPSAIDATPPDKLEETAVTGEFEGAIETAGALESASDTSGPAVPESAASESPAATDSRPEPAAPAAEPAVDPEAPAAPTDTPLEDVVLALNQQRGVLLALLLGADRPRPAAVQQALTAYIETIREASQAGVPVSEEAACLADEAARRHQEVLPAEHEGFVQASARIQKAVEENDAFFERLSELVGEVDAELTRLEPGDPRLETASEELKARLFNYRKGLEIIQRMIGRIVERRKPLSPAPPTPLAEQLEPGAFPAEPEQLAAFAESLSRRYHDVRDTNYHAVADANKHADGCRQALFAAARQLLSAVDGIDSGLANQAELRASLLSLLQDESTGSLLDDWLAAYGRVDERVARFFEAVGIIAHTVERGTRFDPERMEPQAAVAEPELKDEDVAAMVRRGFSLGDEPIRPIIVDVVRNG